MPWRDIDSPEFGLFPGSVGAYRALGRSGGMTPADDEEDVLMTMPSDAADSVESHGSNEGPRDHDGVDTEHVAYVDEDNVPHPGDANEAD